MSPAPLLDLACSFCISSRARRCCSSSSLFDASTTARRIERCALYSSLFTTRGVLDLSLSKLLTLSSVRTCSGKFMGFNEFFCHIAGLCPVDGLLSSLSKDFDLVFLFSTAGDGTELIGFTKLFLIANPLPWCCTASANPWLSAPLSPSSSIQTGPSECSSSPTSNEDGDKNPPAGIGSVGLRSLIASMTGCKESFSNMGVVDRIIGWVGLAWPFIKRRKSSYVI
mmetsp:Transcript_11214/g.27567  ORF Transcript_11214/g.27567 Transcript_11214/m.27567 type:complete len:225 (+) Transcript_11214:656-1330(+)